MARIQVRFVDSSNSTEIAREIYTCESDTLDYQLPSQLTALSGVGGVDYALEFTFNGLYCIPGDVITLDPDTNTNSSRYIFIIYVNVTEPDPSGGGEGSSTWFPGGPLDPVIGENEEGDSFYILPQGQYWFGTTLSSTYSVGGLPAAEDPLYEGSTYEVLHFTTSPTFTGYSNSNSADSYDIFEYFGISVVPEGDGVDTDIVYFYGYDYDQMINDLVTRVFTSGSGVQTDGFTMNLPYNQKVSANLYYFITQNTTYSTPKKISGCWTFNDTYDPNTHFYESVNFTCDEQEYYLMRNDSGYLYYGDSCVGDFGGWTFEDYRYVDFGETPQTVSYEFYAWLVANAGMGNELPEISLSGAMLTITPVTNAISYDIYANNKKIANVANTNIDLSSIITSYGGTYGITVKAIYSTGESAHSNSVIYELAYVMTQAALSDAGNGITLATENTMANQNIGVHLNYLDIIKLNNPTNIKSGETLFGISGTYSADNERLTQAGVVIHDGYTTSIYPFYGDLTSSWTLSNSTLTFSDGRKYRFISSPSKTLIGLSYEPNGALCLGPNGWSQLSNIEDEIFEYWAVYTE